MPATLSWTASMNSTRQSALAGLQRSEKPKYLLLDRLKGKPTNRNMEDVAHIFLIRLQNGVGTFFLTIAQN